MGNFTDLHDAPTYGEYSPGPPGPLDAVDCDGQPIPPGETPDTTVRVWKITPGRPGSDHEWVRDHRRAEWYATNMIGVMMEGAAEGVPARVEVELVSVRLGDYLESLHRDDR